MNRAVFLLTTAMTSIAVAVPHVRAQQQNGEQTVEEIVVTGSYIKRKSQADSPSPIAVIGSGELARQGVKSISDLTQNLTINSGAQNNPDAFNQNYTAGTANINLRGLGVGSTLVLLNSKRQVSSAVATNDGVSFIDTAALVPQIAIDTVEVLKNGAAATYGSDAIGGVANFRTRSNFKGFEIQFEDQSVTKGSQDDLSVSAILGHQAENWHIVASGSYLDRTALSQREKDLRPDWAYAAPYNMEVSTQTGFPGNYIVPVVPAGAPLATQLAWLTAYDKVMPDFRISGIPLAGAGGVNNPSAPFFPFILPVPGELLSAQLNAVVTNVFSGYTTPGVAGYGGAPGSFGTLGADGIADALEALVWAQAMPSINAAYNAAFNLPAAHQWQLPTVGPVTSTPSGVSWGNDPTSGLASSTPLLPWMPDPDCAAVANVVPDTVDLTKTVAGGKIGGCGYDYHNAFDLVPRTKRGQGYVEFGGDLGEHAQMYGDFGFTISRATRQNSSFPIPGRISLDDSYPFNPFGVPVFWFGRVPGAGQVAKGFSTIDVNPTRHDSETYRGMLGVKGDLGGSWTFDTSVTYGYNKFKLTSADGVTSRFFAALQGLGGPDCHTETPGENGCHFYNLSGTAYLASGSDTIPWTNENGDTIDLPVANSQEMLNWLFTPVIIDMKSKMWVGDAVASGDLFDFNGRTVSAAIGAQYRRESLAWDYDSFTNAGDRLFVGVASDFDDSRKVWAVFSELAVPLADKLDLQAALRYEKYNGEVGDTLNPKIALLYRPMDRLSLRGSFGTSFHAPSVFQLYGSQTRVDNVQDSRPGQGSPYLPIVSTGTTDLKPEKAKNWNFGFSAAPADDFEFSLDYWRISYTDALVQDSQQTLFNSAFPNGVYNGSNLVSCKDAVGPTVQIVLDCSGTFNPSANLLYIKTKFRNAAYIKTDGLDGSASWTIDAGNFGTMRLGAEATYLFTYNLEDLDGSEIRGAGLRNYENFADPMPRFRGNLTWGWNKGAHSLLAAMRYVSSFKDDQNCALADGKPQIGYVPGTACASYVKIKSMTTFDANYTLSLKTIAGMKEASLSLGVRNMFDKRPPFVFTDTAYEAKVHDPRGRMVYFGLKAGF